MSPRRRPPAPGRFSLADVPEALLHYRSEDWADREAWQEAREQWERATGLNITREQLARLRAIAASRRGGQQ